MHTSAPPAARRPPRFARTCRDVTRLVLLGEERRLGWIERIAVRSHMMICKACPTFERQIAFLRSATGRWAAYGEPGDGNPSKHPTRPPQT